jgi:DASS family divalent anion:Na+ symporter
VVGHFPKHAFIVPETVKTIELDLQLRYIPTVATARLKLEDIHYMSISTATTTTAVSTSNAGWQGVKLKQGLVVLGLILAIWFTPAPAGLSVQAWHLFAIFITSIVCIVVKPLPMGAMAILSMSACIFTNTLTVEQTLSSFNSKTIWLIVIAFLLARGFIKTGLGSRVAYYFVYFLGKSTLGLGYGLMFTEFLLSPFVPSNTARGAGIIYPLTTSLSKEFNSDPKDNTHRRMGSFLITICYHTNLITSTMFVTAMACNPLIVIFATDFGVNLTWLSWAKATIVPGLISLLSLPLIIYYVYPPEIKKTPGAKEFATERLKAMGPVSKNEWLMLSTFGLLLVLWMFGEMIGVDATGAAFLGLALLLVGGVLTWDDILSERNAWDTFIWLTVLLMMTNFLAKFGMISWFSGHMQTMVTGYSWPAALAILIIVFFSSHYFFASLTAFISSLYSAFTAVAIATGTPPELAVLMFAFIATLSACTTHYGTGTGPVYFGTNYIPVSRWWSIGAIMGLTHIVVWCGIGLSWWKFIGIW